MEHAPGRSTRSAQPSAYMSTSKSMWPALQTIFPRTGSHKRSRTLIAPPMKGLTLMQYILNEPTPGVCPICGYCWAFDVNLDCPCTRPRPGDAEEMEKAYRQSASCRNAKLRAETLEATRRMDAAIQPHRQRRGSPDNVVPIGRARRAPPASA